MTVAHTQHRPLLRRAQPEVPVVHQKLDAVLLGVMDTCARYNPTLLRPAHSRW